jgi:hypothetical protein
LDDEHDCHEDDPPHHPPNFEDRDERHGWDWYEPYCDTNKARKGSDKTCRECGKWMDKRSHGHVLPTAHRKFWCMGPEVPV